jgi:hypothetical protein
MAGTYRLTPVTRLINWLSVGLIKAGAATSYAHILTVRGRLRSTQVDVITVGQHRSGGLGALADGRVVQGGQEPHELSGRAVGVDRAGDLEQGGARNALGDQEQRVGAGARQDATRRISRRSAHRRARCPSATAGPVCRPGREP